MRSECAPVLSPPAPLSPVQSPRAIERGPWLRLVSQVLNLSGDQAQFVSHAERAWTSSLFCGARHLIVLRFEQIAAILAGEDFIEQLEDHEFSISGQIVADATVTAVHHDTVPEPRMTVEMEFLLIQER